MRLSHPEELAVINSVLDAHGAAAEPAALQAHWLVEADLRGHRSHGLQRLPVIARRIDAGLSRPNAEPAARVANALGRGDRRRSNARTNGGDVRGRRITERVATTGIALAAVRNANHLGLLALYVEALAKRGLIGVALTTTEPLMHPWNGSAAMIGTNPVAIGLPTEGEPFVLDMATSAISMGKVLGPPPLRIELASRRVGRSTRAGAPTTDPHVARALSPFGGPRATGWRSPSA